MQNEHTVSLDLEWRNNDIRLRIALEDAKGQQQITFLVHASCAFPIKLFAIILHPAAAGTGILEVSATTVYTGR